MRQQHIVIGMRKLQPVDHMTDRGGVGRAKPVVLQIKVVNDRGNPGDGRFLNLEDIAQRFKRTALSLVAELDAEHIEGNSIFRGTIAVRGAVDLLGKTSSHNR